MTKQVLNSMLILCLGAGLIFLGCSGRVNPTPHHGGNGGGAQEVQVLSPHPDGTDGLLYTVGIAQSRDLSMARSMATQRARANMALKGKAQVTALSKDFQQQLGAGEKAKVNAVFSQVSEGLADETLRGTAIITTKATEKNGLYDVQLMLGMPIKSNIGDPLTEEISQDEALYQEFQAWKGHNELAEKVKELREREQEGQ